MQETVSRRPAPWLLLPIVLGLSAGCAAGRFPYAEAPQVSVKNVRSLRAMAAADLLCDEDDLTIEPGGPSLFTVSGCARRSDYLLLCAYGHCRFREVGSLPDRAAFDLACDGPVASEHLGGNAWGVTACGRRATYVAACGAATNCAWVPASAMPLVDAVEGVREAPEPDAQPIEESDEAMDADATAGAADAGPTAATPVAPEAPEG